MGLFSRKKEVNATPAAKPASAAPLIDRPLEPPPPERLPYELTARIFTLAIPPFVEDGTLRDRRRHLLTVCRLSRTWCAFGQPLLFQDIIVDSPRGLERLLTLIQKGKGLVQHVRSFWIHFTGETDYEDGPQYESNPLYGFSHLMRLCPGLEELGVRGSEMCKQKIRSEVLGNAKSLKKLILVDAEVFHNPPPVEIKLFGKKKDPPPTPPNPPLTLQHLSLTRSKFVNSWTGHSLTTEQQPTITAVSITDFTLYLSPSLSSLSTAYAPFTRTLRALSLLEPSPSLLASLPQILSTFTALQILALPIVALSDQLLSTLPPTLSHLLLTSSAPTGFRGLLFPRPAEPSVELPLYRPALFSLCRAFVENWSGVVGLEKMWIPGRVMKLWEEWGEEGWRDVLGGAERREVGVERWEEETGSMRRGAKGGREREDGFWKLVEEVGV